MNCHCVQDQLAAYSAGELSSSEGAAFQAHCASCPACRHEWEAFERTLLALSVLSQPLPSAQASTQMWGVCSDAWHARIEEQRLASASFWERSLSWARHQPRWGWAALGAAIAIFGSVWMMSPGSDPQNAYAGIPIDGGPVMVIGEPNSAVRFARPPATAAAAVNYHTSMSFDPFVDHVGSSLVSSSAVPPAEFPAPPPIGSSAVPPEGAPVLGPGVSSR